MPVKMPDIPPARFESEWAAMGEAEREALVEQAAFLPPADGILPVLHGMNSFHYHVRVKAKKSLNAIVRTIGDRLTYAGDEQALEEALKESVRVSAQVYTHIRPDVPFNDLQYYVKTLLDLGERGAFWVFKGLYQGRLPANVLKKATLAAEEIQRLILVDQYLQATPAIRLKFAALFRQFLDSVQHRGPVIEFYAILFDRKQDADPFLNNIRPALRDPETMMDKEMASQSPETRIMALKALSMMKVKIPVPILMESIEAEEVKKVRLAVYSLIENSSMGTYPELFDPIFNHFVQSDPIEAVNAFKALAITGKMPIHRLMVKVRETCPAVLPNILIEISSLSRLSFFVIQDIALNKEAYQAANFDVNLACIFGMIKKRPERVVRILKAYDERLENRLKIDVTGFMEKTARLLQKEKESIASRFDALASVLDQPPPEKPKGLLGTIRKDPHQKKLEALRSRALASGGDFSGMDIRSEEFSGLVLNRGSGFFTQTRFVRTDLSASRIEKAFFRNAVFYNVNMDRAVFRGTNFDGAVFINVSATRARFENCSFQGAGMFNCNFNQAKMTGALFLEAEIAKCAFGHTDLTCASFAHARISGVSFATAYLNMGDFSGVEARFCRFPSYARSVIRTDGIDYNARVHQLSFNDIPQIGRPLAAEVNMLIFCEFIHYGEEKFLAQNKLSLLTAFDIFKPAQADYFQVLPLMLHENLALPDADPPEPDTPCGIADYLPSAETLKAAEKYAGGKKLVARRQFSPSIQGLFSMGSVGSLAQTGESDIDYWVCIREDRMDRRAIALLQKKLNSLETMAWEKFKVRVTFFVVDILRARNNDFGDTSQESSGTAQARLLKEEFYRTMIHVAGKLPLWAVLPTTISLNYYNLILDRINRVTKAHRYIDLGDIHAIPVSEYFGASIWQMFKWLKSPFKSVIKMALLEKYIHSYGKETLLCNQYKNEWMNSGTHLKPAQNDSYIILLNHLIAFFIQAADERSVNLLLTCFFLKLGISKPSEIERSALGLRRILLERSLYDWGWTLQKVVEIGRFKTWPYASIQRLSVTIERYMVAKYKDLKNRFDRQSGSGPMISEQDRVVLERKVNIVFQDKPNKIKQLLLVSKGDRHFSKLLIKHLPIPGRFGRWELIHQIPRQHNRNQETVTRADTIEEIGAWLINNHLYTDQTFLGLVPNPTPIAHDDIERLFRAMYEFFEPELKKTVRFHALRRQPPAITCLFVSMNFYVSRPVARIADYTAVYMNSWGEMYLRSTGADGTDLAGPDAVKQAILGALHLKKMPDNTQLYLSRGRAI